MGGIGQRGFKKVAFGGLLIVAMACSGLAWADGRCEDERGASSRGIRQPETTSRRSASASTGRPILRLRSESPSRYHLGGAKAPHAGRATSAVAKGLSGTTAFPSEAAANPPPSSKDVAAVSLSALTAPVKSATGPPPAGWWGCLADCLDSAGVGLFDILACAGTCGVAVAFGVGVWGCAICVGVGAGLVGLCGHLCWIYA